MKKHFIIIIFLFTGLFTYGQQLGVFQDSQQKFYIFDADHFYKAEYLPVKDYWVGKNYVAYIGNNGRFTMYYQGKKHEITPANVSIRATDNFLAYFIDEQLWIFDGREVKFLEPWVKTDNSTTDIRSFPSFDISDDILAFTNSFERFYVYENGKSNEIELWDVKALDAGNNIIAYTNDSDFFKAYYKGTKYELEDNIPQSFQANKDIIAYVDNYGTFKVWDKGQTKELQDIRPIRYYTGENMVAYTDDMNQFVCYYEGVLYDVIDYTPNNIIMQDDILVYNDNRDYTHVFYKGKNIRLTPYKARNIVVNDDFIVYQDL
ncbi:MAG: hypothetical protein ACI8ZX_003216, partial [Planctomycetota bacterium]